MSEQGTNLVDVILGVSVETDDEYSNLKDLTDALKGISKAGGKIKIESGKEEILESDEEIKASLVKLNRETQDEVEESTETTEKNIHKTERTVLNKIDQIWQNVKITPQILRGSTGLSTLAQSLIKDPLGTMTGAGVKYTAGKGTKNIGGLTRALNLQKDTDIEQSLADLMRELGKYIDKMNVVGNIADAERGKKLLSEISTLGGAPETKTVQEIVKTLYPEMGYHVGLGAAWKEAQQRRELSTTSGKMQITFEENRLWRYAQDLPSTGKEYKFSKAEAFALSKMQKEANKFKDKKKRMAKFDELFSESELFGETDVKDWASGKNMRMTLPKTMAEILGSKLDQVVRPDLTIAITEKLSKMEFKDEFREALEKQGGRIDEALFKAVSEYLYEQMKDIGDEGGLFLTALADISSSGKIGKEARRLGFTEKFGFISPFLPTPQAEKFGVANLVEKGVPIHTQYKITEEQREDFLSERQGKEFTRSLDTMIELTRDMKKSYIKKLDEVDKKFDILWKSIRKLTGD